MLQKDYPRLGMREMADNDILVDPAFRDRIHQWFTARGYEAVQYRQGIHDAYHKPPIFNFEIHTALFQTELFPRWRDYLEHLEERLLPLEGTKYGRRFSCEDFYLYMMAHMYKHFSHSGTGLRSLVDCWVFCRARGDSLDWAYIGAESRAMGLEDLALQTRALAQAMFQEGRPLTREERDRLVYYLTSGTYGTTRHRIQNQLRDLSGGGREDRLGTKLRYLRWRMFPGRDHMELWCRKRAPFFLRHPRLLPLAWGCRMVYCCAHGAGRGWRVLRTLWKL